MTAGPSDADLRDAAARLGEALLARGWTIALAESSTAGLIAATVANVPGASRYLLGGVIAYADEAKVDLLGVSADTIAAHGAVSAEVAARMAAEARSRLRADLGVAVTGIAGPDGGSKAKPVGLHFVAVQGPAGPPTVERFVFTHDRDGNRLAATLASLTLAISAAGDS